jgi:tRNA(Ile)-lysidine synthase
MIKLFNEYVDKQSLPIRDKKLLLAVSGGVDSMVMLHLMISSGYSVEAAHCNFGLRGKESDLDEIFISEYCKTRDITFYSKRFDTVEHSKTPGVSIQMAARELRYKWFESLRIDQNLDYICLAHNKNDNVETFFINLLRGTGISGLTGIDPLSNYLVRPLLFATREMIENYATKNGVTYREDSSNIETKYLRNRVRHLILPQFEKINPDAISTIDESIKKLSDAANVFKSTILSVKEKIVIRSKNHFEILKEDLLTLQPIDIYLYEIFNEYGTTPGQIEELKSLLKAETGKMVITPSYRIISDRKSILIVPNSVVNNDPIIINNENDLLNHNHFFIVNRVNKERFKPVQESNTIWIDANKLQYPITIRRWQNGDSFSPYGLKGSKKISDLLIDIKMPIHQKESVRVVISGDKIVWIIGIKADRHFNVSNSCNNIMELVPV